MKDASESTLLDLIVALRGEAPRALFAHGWFIFPRRGRAVKAAEALLASIGISTRVTGLMLRVEREYSIVLHFSGDVPVAAVIAPEGGERLIFKAREAVVVAPYGHAYFELYTLLQRRLEESENDYWSPWWPSPDPQSLTWFKT